MTDQRDTPDTRTPSAEVCATCGDAIAYYGKARGWRHAFDGNSPLDHPAAPTEGTADRDALVERLRGIDPEGRSYAHVMTPLTHSLIREAADALEDLTRENERLRASVDDVVRSREATRLAVDNCAQDASDLRRQVAAVRALCDAAERNHGGPNPEAWVSTAGLRAALDTASEDRGDSQGAVRDG